MGWTRVAPNLLIKPNNFRGNVDIGISEAGKFVFVSDESDSFLDDYGKVKFTFTEGTMYFSASTMLTMVMENTTNG